MNNDEPTQRSTLLDATFAASLAGEPELSLDVDAITAHGARRLRRRRSTAVSEVAASVAFLTAGIAIAVPRLNAGTSAAAPAGAQGCQTVLATNDPAYQFWKDAFLGGTSSVPAKTTQSGDAVGAAGDAGAALTAGASATDPMHPSWYTPGKAAAMSGALLAALPAGTELRSASSDGKTPEPQPFSLAAGPLASGMLQLGNDRGLLQLFVQPGNPNAGASPCIESAGLRYTAPDGTVATVTSGTAPDTARIWSPTQSTPMAPGSAPTCRSHRQRASLPGYPSPPLNWPESLQPQGYQSLASASSSRRTVPEDPSPLPDAAAGALMVEGHVVGVVTKSATPSPAR